MYWFSAYTVITFLTSIDQVIVVMETCCVTEFLNNTGWSFYLKTRKPISHPPRCRKCLRTLFLVLQIPRPWFSFTQSYLHFRCFTKKRSPCVRRAECLHRSERYRVGCDDMTTHGRRRLWPEFMAMTRLLHAYACKLTRRLQSQDRTREPAAATQSIRKRFAENLWFL